MLTARAFALAAALTGASALTVLEVLQQRTDLGNLYEAVVRGNFSNVLHAPGSAMTLLAPNNMALAAFVARYPAEAAVALQTKAELTVLLTYHILPGTMNTTQLVDMGAALGGSLMTLSGQPLRVSGASPATLVLNDATRIVSTNIVADNGIVQVLDAVLLPPSLFPTPSPSPTPSASASPHAAVVGTSGASAIAIAALTAILAAAGVAYTLQQA